MLELLGLELGVTLTLRDVDARRQPPPSAEEAARLPLRPPVVTLMGHVDHGKTSLLDAFRGSAVVASEAGGITQGISAFVVEAGTPRAITFIDTPGHELFAAMRQRGASATDIIVLVVALDAGVQGTTREAIKYALEMGIPLVVAANKVDAPGTKDRVDKLQQQLMQEGVLLDGLGGDVPVVPVSATKHINLDQLKEAVLLQAEMLELHARDDGPAEGVVLEAMVHKGLGVLTTAIVQSGRLRPSDFVVVGNTWGRVRTMQDEGGRALKEAAPSTPIRFSGLKELPKAGDELLRVESESRAKQVCEFRTSKAEALLAATAPALKGRRRSAVKSIPMLLKADSQGSLEAVQEGVSHFPTNLVQLAIVRAGVGALNEADVHLASTVGASIVGFNVSAPNKVLSLATQLDVGVHTYKVIYELIDGVKDILESAIDPILEEQTTGTAEVLDVFTLTLNRKDRKEGMGKKTVVAGARVTSGQATNNSKVRVIRHEEQVYDGHVISLRHFKQEVRSLKKGSECGMILNNFSDVQQGDQIAFYDTVARKRHLYDHADEGDDSEASSSHR